MALVSIDDYAPSTIGSELIVSRSKEVSQSVRQPPLQARSQETRSRILQSARKIFAETGFIAANVRDIAKEAGTTHAMIRYHFGTKDELWREAVRGMFETLENVIAEANQQARQQNLDLRETYRRMTHAYTRYCAKHPEHARIMIMESISGSERFNWMIDEFVKLDHAGGKSVVEELVRQGTLPDIPFASYIYAYVGMIQMPFVLAKEARVALNYDFLSDAAIESHADAVFNIWVGEGRLIVD
jgi:TetR/AcrR family transcriptional regulator